MSTSKYIIHGSEKSEKNYAVSMAKLQWDFMHEIDKICKYYNQDVVEAMSQFALAMGRAAWDVKQGKWLHD